MDSYRENKQALRKEIEEKTKDFLTNGGKIEKCQSIITMLKYKTFPAYLCGNEKEMILENKK